MISLRDLIAALVIMADITVFALILGALLP
jgi:hypothetical protein